MSCKQQRKNKKNIIILLWLAAALALLLIALIPAGKELTAFLGIVPVYLIVRGIKIYLKFRQIESLHNEIDGQIGELMQKMKQQRESEIA